MHDAATQRGQCDGMVKIWVRRTCTPCTVSSCCLTSHKHPPSNHHCAGSGALFDLRSAETPQLSSCRYFYIACNRTGRAHTVPFRLPTPFALKSPKRFIRVPCPGDDRATFPRRWWSGSSSPDKGDERLFLSLVDVLEVATQGAE